MNIQKITSRNNQYIKDIVKLRDKKHREQESLSAFAVQLETIRLMAFHMMKS